jgi:hypothetical protein
MPGSARNARFYYCFFLPPLTDGKRGAADASL